MASFPGVASPPPKADGAAQVASPQQAAAGAGAGPVVTATTGPESLLNFNIALDVALLDQVLTAFLVDGQMQLQQLVVGFQNHPQSWMRVSTILEKSTNPHTRMLALNVLENAIKVRWNVLPPQQREGIKTYMVNLVIKLSSDAKTLKEQRMFINKANKVLVEVVKHEWPHRWPNFIKELVMSAKTSQTLCTNNMNILLLLSEEIFDFSAGQMTSTKMAEMKKNLNTEFTQIYGLCEFILEHSQDPQLLSTTLKTVLRFLHWVPVGYIFETKLIGTLALKFFPVAQFQNDTLACLTEIGSLDLKEHPQYNQKFVQLFVIVTGNCAKLLTAETDVGKAFAGGDPNIQRFVRQLALFITGYLKSHLHLLEAGDDNVKKALVASLSHLLRLSKVDDTIVFKICLEYWSTLVMDLYKSATMQPGFGAGLNLGGLTAGNKAPLSPRMQLYAECLSHLRRVMIQKMAKPEEVLIVEDEHGQIVRETLKDTDSVTLYKNMRECLIYLTNLDTNDTRDIMLHTLQTDG